MNKLSIIIPVYNVEKYVGKCVESILQQQNLHNNNIEVLFVIDGSKDNSESIIKEKLRHTNHTNVKILVKENGGLSSARNFGIENTNGQYIWFVDSDDWIEPDSVLHIFSIIDKYNPEIIAQTHYFQETSSKTNHIKRYQYAGFIQGGIFCGKDHSTAAQFYIIQRKFWCDNSFRFRLGMYHEDGELTPRILYKAEKIYVTTKPIYHILVREGSITHSVNPKRCYDYMIVLDTLYLFYKNEVKHEHYQAFSSLMSNHVLGLMNLALQIDADTQKDIQAYLTKNKSFIDILQKSGKLKLIIFSLLIRISPFSSVELYKYIKKWK